MGKGGLGIGIAGAAGAASGALAAGIAGISGPVGWVAFGAYTLGFAAIGAATAAAGVLLNRPPSANKRKSDDTIETTTVRTKPVPIAFGRSRAGGNWVNVGAFWIIKDFLKTTPGRSLRWMNAVLALCEGGPNGIAAMGNIRQDGALRSTLAAQEKLDTLSVRGNKLDFWPLTGTSTQAVDAYIDNAIADLLFSASTGTVHTGETAVGASSGATATAITAIDPGGGQIRVQLTLFADPTGLPTRFIGGETVNFSGGGSVTVSGLTEQTNGYNSPFIPLRNTAQLVARTVCGTAARMPDVNIDLVGPELTIRRSGTTGESPSGDVLYKAFFDSYSDSFYYTVNNTSGATATPFGLVSVGRQGQARVHTQPPTAVVSNVTMAWYLGRHDVLVMQDPADPTAFWLGNWGMSRSDPGWEQHHPQPEQGGAAYGNPILVWYLDEVAGILHTLHDEGTNRYILRWWLLSGRVQKAVVPIAAGTFYAMLFSPDLNCYVFSSDTARLEFVAQDGSFLNGTNLVTTAGTLGLCVSGQLAGVITNGAITYYDPVHYLVSGPFGNSSTDATVGGLSGVLSACQNSFTGHVTLGKNDGGQPLLVNFIPSVPESVLDLQANGTSGMGGLPDPTIITTHRAQPNFQDFTAGYFLAYEAGIGNPTSANSTGWCRDWSARAYNSWNLVALQGHSSLAAAAWAVLVDEPNLDSRRFGAGLNAKYFNLGSFEGLHWYCVGGMQFSNPGDVTHGYQPQDPSSGASIGGPKRYAERYKFDLLLESETNVSSFISDDILMTCQGYRTTVAGVMYVGVDKSGQWPQWTFTEKQIQEEAEGQSSLQIAFPGRSDAPNKVRVQYRDVLNEYAHDYAEVTDGWEIDTWAKTHTVTVTADGCARYDSAFLLANAILDNSRGRRQFTFKTSFLSHLLYAGDVIEISDSQCAMLRVPAKIVSLVESGDKAFEITAIEHNPTLDALSAQIVPGATPGSGPFPPGSDQCPAQECPLGGGSTIAWVEQGATFPAGTLVVNYLSGTYQSAMGLTYSVAGFEVVVRDASSGVITVLGNAPALSGPWSDQGLAEQENLGQTTTFTLASAGSIGLRRIGGAYAAALGSNAPTYEFCIGVASGGGTGGSSSSSSSESFMGF